MIFHVNIEKAEDEWIVVECPALPGCVSQGRDEKEAVKAFKKGGWQKIGQVGSHLVMSKPGIRVNLSIPQHKELSIGTLRALIRNSGMTVDAFIKLLK